MPPFGGPSQGATGDIWLQNKFTIERLYVVENKTAEDVMETMEREYGCPHITKKAFQKIIRNKLKLSKRLKKGDWPRIYRNYLLHRKDIPTVVYHNTRKIIWKDVIKETKRSGPLPDTGQDGDATLPMDVVLRTPSPPPSPSPSLGGSRMSHSPPTNLQQLTGSLTGSSPQPAAFSPTALVGALDADLPVSTRVGIDSALNGIPWIKFNYRMLSTAMFPHDSDTNLPLDLNSLRSLIDTRLEMDSFRIWRAAVPSTRLHFLSTMPSSSALTPDIHAYHLLAKVVYLTSNNLHHKPCGRQHDIFTGTIQLLSSQIPKKVLSTLFQQNLPIHRIIWEHLIECAGISSYYDTFTSLIKAGLRHKEWILSKGALYLSFAASMNALDVVQDLLDFGIRADAVVSGRDHPVIIEAAASGNIECVKLLIGACDVNRKIIRNASNFQILLFTLAKGELCIPTNRNYANLPSFPKGTRSDEFTTASINLKNDAQRLILKMFLDCGANVDLPWATRLTSDNQVYDVPEEWCLTTFEKTRYWDKSLFKELAPYSSITTGRSFRPKICSLALLGKEHLRQYVYLRSAESDLTAEVFLEWVLLQQVIDDEIIDIEDVRTNIDVIRGLLESGVDPNLSSLEHYKSEYYSFDIHDLLKYLVLKPDAHRLGESFDVVLRLILQSGATINSEVLAAGVRKEGIDILEALVRVGADAGQYGATALVLAARFDNYDAVKWLLDSGVDINAEVPSLQRSVISLASSSNTCCPRCWKRHCGHRKLSDSASCEMLRYLVDCGAALKYHPDDPNSFRFLYNLLREYEANGSLFNMMELFLPKLRPHDLLPLLPLGNFGESLWEACLYSRKQHHPNEKQAETRREKIAVLELLFKHDLLVQDALALPNLIYYRGPPELIERLLESCMNLNTYVKVLGCGFTGSLIQYAAYQGDKALVEKLLQKGADIDQEAAEMDGKTALQAACDWKEVPAGEEAKRVGLIQLLIEKGAYINAPGSMYYGRTALEIAVEQGNMEVVLLLIYGGAVVNTPNLCGYNALDMAVMNGRLDIVRLLLNVGALSGIRGQTGFDGAIEDAERRKYFAVANLIRQYAEEHSRDGLVSGGLKTERE
ncbi:hypothetical protein F4813DRAFT_370940 [Daldinia decipiens]|uniref:uncharacterized protein n=1 Tax=Daldinia decipiens TaxID=326647 RepID=UPI0020C3AF9D|nr:uncharacterized protein F4813DRAFT_370940 [Daldinia decipiens]KAI1654452.1 hypothetical protein F4813DRAFT_370940 [Daldinia decipiens]